MTTDALGTGGGIVSAQEHRLANTALLASLPSGILDVRTGVFPGPNSLTLVTGTSATGTMTVAIAAHQAATSRTSAQGTYLGPTLETATTVNIAAAPGANSRIDVVYAKQGDADASVLTPDATSAPIYGVVTGTAAASPVKPSLPVGAVELATVTVAAGATATNGAGVTIANTARQVVAAGGIYPARAGDSTAGSYVGQYRDDPTGGLQRWNGSGWVPYATTASVTATTGNVAFAAGWKVYSGYYSPACRISADGSVTMRGMFMRNGANLALPIGGAVTLGTIPASATPAWNVSAIVAVGLGANQDSYPARLFIAANSTAVQVIGMNTGSGTFFQNLGFVSCDGVSWYL